MRDLVTREFSQITPENELKWPYVQPSEGVFDFAAADALVEFAERSGLEVRGHTLIWGQAQGNGMPDLPRHRTRRKPHAEPQGHFAGGSAPPQGPLESLARELRALGVEVAITELDIASTAAAKQAQAFRQVGGECLDGGCTEVTVWGVPDASSWLDRRLGRPARPLLFDEMLRPKPAYEALRDELLRR